MTVLVGGVAFAPVLAQDAHKSFFGCLVRNYFHCGAKIENRANYGFIFKCVLVLYSELWLKLVLLYLVWLWLGTLAV